MGFTAFLLKNLLRRKVRSLLTTLGIALAVGTMVTLLGISDSFEESFHRFFSNRDVALVVLARDQPMQLGSVLDQKIGDRILKIPGVKAIDYGLSDYTIVHMGPDDGGTDINVIVQGWPPDSLMLPKFHFLSGRKFDEGESGVALLGIRLAESLKKQVGDYVLLGGQDRLKIVGIYEGPSALENSFLVMPLADMQRLLGKPGKVTGFSVVLDRQDKELVDSVKQQIEDMKGKDGKSLRLSADGLSNYIGNMIYVKIVHAMTIVISVIAVVICLVGMLNTMLMAVFERVKEIGILRAIGWRRFRVVRMVLGESLLLSLAGAAVGIVAAIFAMMWLTRLPEVSGFIEGEISGLVILKAIVVAGAVGLIGGIYPALRAANLKPTEALRHE